MTATSTKPSTRYAAQELALIAGRNRMRRVRRGVHVPPPADHARHVVSLLSKVPNYGLESRATEDRVHEAYAQRFCSLAWLTAPVERVR
jgi:hypothetical protein